MYLQPVNLYSITNHQPVIKKNKINKKTEGVTDSFDKSTTSFTGYKESLLKMSERNFDNVSKLKEGFHELLNLVTKDTEIKKTDNFQIIKTAYEKDGLRELLRNLWLHNSDNPVGKFSNKLLEEPNETLVLATKNEKPVLTIKNWGPFKLWDALSDNRKCPRDVRIQFTDKNKTMATEFTLDKKGNYVTHHSANEQYIFSSYYESTGLKKQETIHPSIGHPETTYYNEDGSKAFFKNWFYGGPAIPPVW